jgi:hypothetical protein
MVSRSEAEHPAATEGSGVGDPALARFVQADTTGGGDRYAYVRNNPVRYTDPTGQRACEGPQGECWYEDPNPKIGGMPVQGWQPAGQRAVQTKATSRAPVEVRAPYFPCESGDLAECQRDMVYGEGGATSYQAAANILQSLHNRVFTSWTCTPNCINPNWNQINPGRVPWEDVTQGEFLQLVLFLSGEQYYSSSGIPIPQYVAWTSELDYQFINSNPVAYGFWAGIGMGVETWLATAAGVTSENAPIFMGPGAIQPAGPLRDPAVMFYYSFAERADPPGAVWLDIVPMGEDQFRYQYYFTYPYHP